MWDTLPPVGELAWPVVIALAWLAGELAQRWNIPRVTTYAVVGFVFGRAIPGASGIGVSPGSSLLASIAFGLLLFEFGYRINLRWFRVNPWLAATGLLDVALTFLAVYALCRTFGAAPRRPRRSPGWSTNCAVQARSPNARCT
jgi:Kef-type K+ transport system membrane component KefB